MFMHLALAAYVVALLLDDFLVGMADPTAALREAASNAGVNLEGLSQEAARSEIDAGRAALNAHLAKLPPEAVPTDQQRFDEPIELWVPWQHHLLQKGPGLLQQAGRQPPLWLHKLVASRFLPCKLTTSHGWIGLPAYAGLPRLSSLLGCSRGPWFSPALPTLALAALFLVEFLAEQATSVILAISGAATTVDRLATVLVVPSSDDGGRGGCTDRQTLVESSE